MVATKENDKTPPRAPVTDSTHSSDAPVAAGPSAAQSEAMALMKANSQAKSTGDNVAGAPGHLDFTPLKELTAQTTGDGTAQAREQLIASATKSFGGDATKLTTFENNMQTFEDRMKSSAFAAPGDVAKTYAEVQKLLDAPTSVVSSEQRATLAADVMERAAHPLESNQGNSTDCAAASIENLLYTKSPALAAKYVSDVAITGKFTDQQGNVVSLDHDTIAVQRPELIDKELKLGVEPRNYGDQIIQASIRNEELALINKGNGISSDGQKGLKYEVQDHDDFENRTGEHIIDYSKKPSKDVTNEYGGGMREDSIANVAVALDSKNAKDKDNLYMDASSVSNADQFKAALSKPEPPYPRVLGVNAAQPPFSKPEDDLGDGGHAITISGYDPKTNLVHFRDPEHASKEQTVDADTMYNGMLTERGDGPMTDDARSLKENRAMIKDHSKDFNDALYEYLQGTVEKQRDSVLKTLSERSGIDLPKLLTEQQKRDLRLAP